MADCLSLPTGMWTAGIQSQPFGPHMWFDEFSHLADFSWPTMALEIEDEDSQISIVVAVVDTEPDSVAVVDTEPEANYVAVVDTEPDAEDPADTEPDVADTEPDSVAVAAEPDANQDANPVEAYLDILKEIIHGHDEDVLDIVAIVNGWA